MFAPILKGLAIMKCDLTTNIIPVRIKIYSKRHCDPLAHRRLHLVVVLSRFDGSDVWTAHYQTRGIS